jgi:amino acid transporter
LLPPVFAKVHPKFKTPHVTTILTGVIVGAFAAVMSIDEMVDLTNIGTLFAFVLVCVGIIILRYKDPDRRRPFRVPSGTLPLLLLGVVVFLVFYYLPQLVGPQVSIFGHQISLPALMMSNTWRYVEPTVFIVATLALLYFYPRSTLGKRLPLGAWSLPLLGAVSCIFLMYYLPPTSWWRFIAWLMIGLSVYLSYGYAKSELGRKVDRPRTTPGWLMLLGLGSMLIAIGILAIPHHNSLSELSAQISGGDGRTIIAAGSIILGVLLGIVGWIVGMAKGNAQA